MVESSLLVSPAEAKVEDSFLQAEVTPEQRTLLILMVHSAEESAGSSSEALEERAASSLTPAVKVANTLVAEVNVGRSF